MRLAELAARLDCELEGDGDIEITGVGTIENAEPGEVTFIANPRYARYLARTKASAVIMAIDGPSAPVASLRAAEPYLAFALAVEQFHRPMRAPLGVHPTAIVAPTARIGPGASIGAYSVVGEGVTIGRDVRLASHVVIYPDVQIGDRFFAHAHVTVREGVRIGNDVILHCGAVIGSDGFGYAVTREGQVHKIVQAGDVSLEDGVEVGANATVDRATVGSTVLRHGVKIDNLVQIGHGCDVGEGSMLAAQVGLAGSTRIGRFVRMGGQAGVGGHLVIGDGVQVAGQGGVASSVAAGTAVGGYPAVEVALWRRMTAALHRLPALVRRVRRLEKHLKLPKSGSDES
jgi:UDP-3-O-[3-hydroxymyristoyl] glucosamine N-acyltransferase